MSETMKTPSQLVFGLDIGTRSIVGTVGYKIGDNFHVTAQCIKEHETRAMLDGQIHDIDKVGATITEVKKALEEKIGTQLKGVCIAAAGRVLRTVTTSVKYEFSGDKEIDGEDIYTLASLGIEKAYKEFLDSNNPDIKFYCVGYSVIRYYLNGYATAVLEGHKANHIGADLIATFLPDDVVDGLYKAVGIAGLEVVNMTLEPIAAIQVAIPQTYRMLNIALVDVGAGTSDISVTRDGSIIAYGMIPIAGDALTEVIAKHCLVDFQTAESIKRQIEEKETIEYKDIMGIKQEITKSQLLEVTRPVILDMTKQVADKIKELNGDKSVSAVFVVGGGGKLEGYTQALAKELEIPDERVAVRGEEGMQNIEFYDDSAKRDSLMVTPIGICLSFYEQSNNFIFVYFNEQRVKLYDNNKLAVVDAAMQAEFANDGLFPKRGKELNYFVNGKPRIARGELGEAAVITVNGHEADIHTIIHANDQISIIEATAGAPAIVEINQLPEYGEVMCVEVNETKIELPEFVSVNGNLQSGYYGIQENDKIEFLSYYTVRQVAEFMDVVINQDMNIYVNNKLADMDTKVYENFSVIWTMEELQLSDRDIYGSGAPDTFENLPDDDGTYVKSEPKKEVDPFEAAAEADTTSSETGNEPDSQNTSEENMTQVSENNETGDAGSGDAGTDHESGQDNSAQNAESNGESAGTDPISINVRVNNDLITLVGKPGYIFVDVFDYIDFDLSKPQGSGIVTEINGRNAQYMEPIHSGDVIKIFWKE